MANIFLDASDVPLRDELHTPESWQQMLALLEDQLVTEFEQPVAHHRRSAR